jgi:arabinogalactan endo-1,4-beta-galactosidase
MKAKWKFLLECSFVCALLFSCGGSGDPQPNSYKAKENVESNLYIKKVDLSDDFIKGMDVSQVISLENSGVKYYNFEGEEEDVLKILADYGMNYIRVRVWNDPFDANGNGYGGGNCTIDTAVELGKRATKYGMKMLVDFHYSDFWADPKRQLAPKAWKGMEIDEKCDALYKYTFDSLTKLKEAGVAVGMVQIGNEINNGLAGESTVSWANKVNLLSQGSKACREVYPSVKVAVHFANPEDTDKYKSYASKLAYYELDYDVFASSYYPYWHGTLDNLKYILNFISDKYDKDVLVAETSYAFNSEDTDFHGNTVGEGDGNDKPQPYTAQGQSNQLVDVIEAVNEMKRGLGVFYWEGCWIGVGTSSYEENLAIWEKYGSGWATSYANSYDLENVGTYYGGCAVENQAFFDSKGKAMEGLKTWLLVNKGNNVPLKVDAVEDTICSFDLNDEIILPTEVNAIMNDGSKQKVSVTWDSFDSDAMKNGGPNKYTIKGRTNDGMEAICYISMIEYNYLTNYSFENGEDGWTFNDISGKSELVVKSEAKNALTGSNQTSFWGSAADSVEISVEQKVQKLQSGTYKFQISIMGGNCGEKGKDYSAYSYVKINGEIIDKKDLSITDWKVWDANPSDNFKYNEGDELIVGIYVKASPSGAWGKIDDGLLNSVKA